jgi:hypothetical protein
LGIIFIKIIAESLSQHDEKHVVPTPLSGITVGRRRDYNDKSKSCFKHYCENERVEE